MTYTMRNSVIKIVTGFIILITITSGKSDQKDPMAIYSEIDKNASPNTLTDKEKQNQWQLLFDGKTSNGWHGYNLTGFPDCWTIKDGTLTMTTKGRGESQDIITDKVYKNFAFYAEFKTGRVSNSGFIFQVAEDKKYKFPYETGPEYQIIDQKGWPEKLEDWQLTGANYAMGAPLAKPYKEVGEWNQAMIVADGNNVTYILNGQVTAKYIKYSPEWIQFRNSGKWSNFPDYGKYDEGHISLQNHGSQVWFRNIKLKVLQ
jgi:hypothetical protein